MKNRTKLPNLYLGLIIVILYLPIALVILYSFNESKISSVWSGFSLKWYETLFRDRAMFEALGNSIVLGLCASFGAAVVGTLGAYGFTKVQLRTKSAVEYLSMLPIMIPEIILGMVFMAFFSLLGLPFGMTTLILAHTTFCIPYVYMLVKARLVGMDPSLAEAARDLGANEARVFFDITLPLLTPAILSGMLLSFAMSLDDVIISIFVTGVNVNTLPIKVYTQIKTGVTPEINALCTLMLGATLLLVVLSNVLGKVGKPKTGKGSHKKAAMEHGKKEENP
ncbi:MAG: ABC transporter permease [Subdoligranulum sp.]|nr:ABC transporter permease [Subdoligranulum sp.]